jgi:hypothetical protein
VGCTPPNHPEAVAFAFLVVIPEGDLRLFFAFCPHPSFSSTHPKINLKTEEKISQTARWFIRTS